MTFNKNGLHDVFWICQGFVKLMLKSLVFGSVVVYIPWKEDYIKQKRNINCLVST